MKIIKRTNKSLYRRLIVWSIFVICTGIYLLTSPGNFDRLEGYSITREVIPVLAWGMTFFGSGLLLLFAIIHGTLYSRTRILLVVIAAFYVMWTLGFLVSFILSGSPTWFTVITYLLISYYAYHFIGEEPYGTNVENKGK